MSDWMNTQVQNEYVEIDDNGKVIMSVTMYANDSMPDNIKSMPPSTITNPQWDSSLNEWIDLGETSDFLTTARENKIAELAKARDSAINTPFVSSNGHTYTFDAVSETNFTQQKLELVADLTILYVQWQTVDAGVVTHTRHDFIQVTNEGKSHKIGNYQRFWAKVQTVMNCTTLQDINNITW